MPAAHEDLRGRFDGGSDLEMVGRLTQQSLMGAEAVPVTRVATPTGAQRFGSRSRTPAVP
jgi:hypothetical protein